MNRPDRYAILSDNIGPCSLQHANSAAAQRFQENSKYGLEKDKRHAHVQSYTVKFQKQKHNLKKIHLINGNMQCNPKGAIQLTT